MFNLVFVFLTFFLIGFGMFRTIQKGERIRKAMTISSDGHTVPENEDFTCENTAGHNHTVNPEYGHRYIVHNEPNNGYVVLNGELRKISDCENL